MQALSLYTEAEERALEIVEQYSSAAADSISYGTFMKLQIAELADSPAVGNMMRWLYANAEFSAAAVATELSVARWAEDDQFSFSGDHIWIPGAIPPHADPGVCLMLLHQLPKALAATLRSLHTHWLLPCDRFTPTGCYPANVSHRSCTLRMRAFTQGMRCVIAQVALHAASAERVGILVSCKRG
jgi:hypothetical protein